MMVKSICLKCLLALTGKIKELYDFPVQLQSRPSNKSESQRPDRFLLLRFACHEINSIFINDNLEIIVQGA